MTAFMVVAEKAILDGPSWYGFISAFAVKLTHWTEDLLLL